MGSQNQRTADLGAWIQAREIRIIQWWASRWVNMKTCLVYDPDVCSKFTF